MENNGLIEVYLKGVEASPMEYALFLGNELKSFTIFVGSDVGSTILMHEQGVKRPRPLTHDLVKNMFLGLGASIEKVIINDLRDSTFYARIFIKEENELGKKIIEVDARPSDSIALALRFNARIFVTRDVFNRVEDVSKFLKDKGQSEQEESE
jgi:bifunctional DNase/RNase